MQQAAVQKEALMPESIVTSRVAIMRLAVGLMQGVVLYFLYHAAKTNAWPATEKYLFAPVLLLAVLAPVILISSLGHLQKRQAGIWMLVVVLLIALLGFHDVWRGGGNGSFWFPQTGRPRVHYPSPLLVVFSVAGFYIAHALVQAGVQDKRRIAAYPTYFEAAWKLLIQIKFSLLFVGVLWLVLTLGAALFMLVKIGFLKDLLQESWFAIPVTVFAFSCAIHITDVRPAIVRGIRTLLLVLLSWLLPIATLIVAGFLLSLPWTGLSALWATRHAASVLLGSAAVLIVLINAAFQNGETASGVARLVRGSVRVAALSLLPLTAIAIYALSLRVNQYGWTTDRIISAACLLVSSCYALGYAWAACRRGGWLEPIAGINVTTAFVVLAVLLGLFTPIADPARLSVNNQIARLAAGKIGADKFDFDYLKFEGARYGAAALKQLAARTQGADAALVREKATLALKKENRWQRIEPELKPVDVSANITVWPNTARLPVSFLQENWNKNTRKWELPRCLFQQKEACDAYQIDLNGDGKPEVLLIGTERFIGAAVMTQGEDGHWTKLGSLPNDLAGCVPLRQKLQAGDFKLVAPRVQDLEIAGQRIEIQDRAVLNAQRCMTPPH
jgi:hypothetical protein